jgi:excisionase family DNA binding protein
MTSLLDTTVEELRAKLPVLLTVEEAADVSRRSQSSIRRAIRSGALPYNQPAGAGGDIRLPRDAVLPWAFSLEMCPAPEMSEPGLSKSRQRDPKANAGVRRKRRAPLRVVARGAQAWSEEEMLRFASGYS